MVVAGGAAAEVRTSAAHVGAAVRTSILVVVGRDSTSVGHPVSTLQAHEAAPALATTEDELRMWRRIRPSGTATQVIRLRLDG
jgi:hypothetical protein